MMCMCTLQGFSPGITVMVDRALNPVMCLPCRARSLKRQATRTTHGCWTTFSLTQRPFYPLAFSALWTRTSLQQLGVFPQKNFLQTISLWSPSLLFCRMYSFIQTAVTDCLRFFKNLKQKWLLAFSNKIQIHKRLKRAFLLWQNTTCYKTTLKYSVVW